MTARSLPLTALLITAMTALGTACTCPSLTMRALRSGAYRVENEIVQLTEGEYRIQAAEDSAAERVVTLTDIIARGDLDGRDGKDAAVILVDDAGGSGTFYHLAALLRRETEFENIDTVFLGDRILVRSVTIDDITHGITVHALVRRDGDAMATPPEVQVVMRYMVVGNTVSVVRPSAPNAVGGSR